MPFPMGEYDWRLRLEESEELVEKHLKALREKIVQNLALEEKYSTLITKTTQTQSCLGGQLLDLTSQNTELRRQNTDLTKQKAELERAHKTELEDAKMEAGQSKTALQNENETLKDKLAKLQQDYATLEDKSEEKDEQLSRYEGLIADQEMDLKEERAKNKELNDTVRKNAGAEKDLEKYIESAEDGNNKLNAQIRSLGLDKDHLNAQLSHEKSVHGRTKSDFEALGLKHKKLSEDAEGVRRLLEAKQEESDRKSETISTLNARIEGLEQAEADLTEAQNVIGGLRDQLERLRDEMPRFNPDPKVFMAPTVPAVPKPSEKAQMPRSLADDLGNLNGNGSPVPSDDEDSDHSSVSSNHDDKNEAIVQVQIREVIREVPGALVYVPYRTSWFQVEVDAARLFQAWLLSTGQAVPFVLNWTWMKASGRLVNQPLIAANPQSTNGALQAGPVGHQGPAEEQGPTENESLAQPQNGIDGGGPMSSATNHTNGATQVPSQPSLPSTNGNTEPGPAIPPPSKSNGTSIPSHETLPVDGEEIASQPATPTMNGDTEQNPAVPPPTANIADETLPVAAPVARRSWWKADVDPNAPPAAQTFIALALHLIVYFSLYFGYLAYCERQMWMAANDNTRRHLLALRNSGDRGIASQILSEENVRLLEFAILRAFSWFGVERRAWQIPG